MKLGYELLVKNFRKIINEEIKPKPQLGIGSYYGKKRSKHTISWQQSAEKINNKIRVHAKPYNPAEAVLFNRYIFINKAKVVFSDKYPAQGCGRIVDIKDGNKLIISCASGCLMLEDFSIFPELTEEDEKIYFKIGNKLN
jgi:methionyl-tRNA formyltransferase